MTAPTPDLLAAVEAAEDEARRLHDAGRCRESEWSCSYCEDWASAHPDA